MCIFKWVYVKWSEYILTPRPLFFLILMMSQIRLQQDVKDWPVLRILIKRDNVYMGIVITWLIEEY